MAINCWDTLAAILGLAGEIARVTSVAVFTVNTADPEMLPDVAEIVVVPAAADAARPFEPAMLLMVATDALAEFQVTSVVRS